MVKYVYVVVAHGYFMDDGQDLSGELNCQVFKTEADALYYCALDPEMYHELFTCPVVG